MRPLLCAFLTACATAQPVHVNVPVHVPDLPAPDPSPSAPLPNGKAAVDYPPASQQLPAHPTDCEIESSDGLRYSGTLRVNGYPFAAGSYVDQGNGTVYLYENTLSAHVQWAGPDFDVSADVNLPDLTLYPRLPVVFDRWIQVLSTRVSTVTSVRGGLLAPEFIIPSWIKPRHVFGEPELRTPCGAFRSTAAEDPIAGASSGDLAPGTTFTLHRAPQGEALADVKVPADGSLTALVIGKQQGWVYLALSAARVRFYGWTTNVAFADSSLGQGAAPSNVSRLDAEPLLDCANVDVFVRTEGASQLVLRQTSPRVILRGRFDAAGNWLVDLGLPAGEPYALTPFVPKEYLPRCVVRTGARSGKRD